MAAALSACAQRESVRASGRDTSTGESAPATKSTTTTVDGSAISDPPPLGAKAAGPVGVERSGANISGDAPVGDPVSISIPSIGVDSKLTPTGVLDDGTVAVPPDPSIAGWFTGGPRPGERGPAVIMGHVDSQTAGPGVFWRLSELSVGAVATVQTSDRSQTFVVQSVEQYPKNAFPTQAVYGPVPQPALRLITCGGSFDNSIGHYRDNIVVFLVPAPA